MGSLRVQPAWSRHGYRSVRRLGTLTQWIRSSLLNSFSSFQSVPELTKKDGAAHIQGGSSLLSQTSLETSSQAHPEVCLPGGSKSRQAEHEDELSVIFLLPCSCLLYQSSFQKPSRKKTQDRCLTSVPRPLAPILILLEPQHTPLEEAVGSMDSSGLGTDRL